MPACRGSYRAFWQSCSSFAIDLAGKRELIAVGIFKTAANPGNARHYHVSLAHGVIRNTAAELDGNLLQTGMSSSNF